jgi:hypothetical protein
MNDQRVAPHCNDLVSVFFYLFSLNLSSNLFDGTILEIRVTENADLLTDDFGSLIR